MWKDFFFSLLAHVCTGAEKAKATEAPPSLGARETAQCFGHVINSQPAGIYPLPSRLREMCARAAFPDVVCSSGRISLWSCD